MQELISEHISPFLPEMEAEVSLRSFDDSAIIEDIVFTTDSHTVKPLFFPGGDIGSLAVAGTVNDIAVMGASPIAMSCALILEEGLEIEKLERVMESVGQYSELSEVPVVTGDTKVMESGAIEEMVIITSAIGKESRYLNHNYVVASEERRVSTKWLTDDNIERGDVILVSGTLGDHGISLISFREGYGFESNVKSDIAPLNHLIEGILEIGGVVSMKDLTRGGLANGINEWSRKSEVGIEIREEDIPISPTVRNACELLGLDPLSIGNEGKMLLACTPNKAHEVLEFMKRSPLSKDASIIGVVTSGERVILNTEVGGRRILEPPVGDPVPRIC